MDRVAPIISHGQIGPGVRVKVPTATEEGHSLPFIRHRS